MTPRITAPACRSRVVTVPSSAATCPRRCSTPPVCGIPATAINSLIEHGMPNSGGSALGFSLCASVVVAASASLRAWAKRSVTSALMAGFTVSMRWMCASRSCVGVSLRATSCSRSSAMDCWVHVSLGGCGSPRWERACCRRSNTLCMRVIMKSPRSVWLLLLGPRPAWAQPR